MLIPATWTPAITELKYSNQVAATWQTPPADQINTAEKLPSNRPSLICVLGSSGFKGSWQAGVMDALEDLAAPIRLDAASGGTIPALALAAGINKQWRRIMNAGVPSQTVLTPATGLRWFERRNLDLAGVYDLSSIETWLAAWLQWAGVKTFADLRYSPEEQEHTGLTYRAGIAVVLWRTKKPFPKICSAEQLCDPAFIHKAFRWAFFSTQFPWQRFEQMWVPDTIDQHLPWLADEIDTHSPAWWARVSMSQWPACLPTVLQDPSTRQLVFLTDGGHIDNQPSLFNGGYRPPLPLFNPRLAQNGRQLSQAWVKRDARRMPFGKVVRFARTPETAFSSLKGGHLTWRDRDAMWRRGITQARERLPVELATLLAKRYAQPTKTPNWQPKVEVPALHGFQLIAAAPRLDRKKVFGLRS